MTVSLALKAVLLSGLVYPGAGHYLLKKHILCFVFAIAFSIPLLVVLNDLMSVARDLSQQIQTGQIPLDIIEIRHQLLHSFTEEKSRNMIMYGYLLLTVWLISIGDAYRIGRQTTS